jgi:hypothetical protein
MRRRANEPTTLTALIALAATLAGLLAAFPVAAGSPDTREAPWAPYIRVADAALADGNVAAAERALNQAYLTALPGRGWEGLVEVGDGYRRVSESPLGVRRQTQAKAREYYLAALFRARQLGSLPGIFRTAEGFAAMGDREPTNACIRVAEGLAARLGDAEAREQARASIERLTQRLFAMETLRTP